MSQVIDVSDLPEPLVEAIETMIRVYRGQGSEPPAKDRDIGWAKDVLNELPDSFFDPLPDELLGLFEGQHA